MVLIFRLVYSGKSHDDTLIAKFETVYTGSGDHGSSMVSTLNSLHSCFSMRLTLISVVVFAVCIQYGARTSSVARVVVL